MGGGGATVHNFYFQFTINFLTNAHQKVGANSILVHFFYVDNLRKMSAPSPLRMPRACWIDNNSVHVLSSILDKPCLVLKSCREFTRPLVRNFKTFSLKNELQSLDSTSACTFDDKAWANQLMIIPLSADSTKCQWRFFINDWQALYLCNDQGMK